MLTPHVVRAGRDRPQGRPAQHKFRLAEAQQVGEVGFAAVELGNGQLTLCARQMRTQIGFEPRRVEPLIRPLSD
jgi:hypothetical protein